MPATSVYVCACDLGHQRQGGWAVRCCEVKPPTPPAAHTAPTHAGARKWVRGGGGRLRLIDAAALTPPLPTHTTAHQGAKEGNLNEAGRWHSNGFDYFRQANGLCWLLRLMANRLQTNILVCLTLAQENAYT